MRYLVLLAIAAASTSALPSAAATPPPAPHATLATFAGTWWGHTRSLRITRDGRAREHLDDGCCTPVLDLTFRLSRPTGTARLAAAVATVTSVRIRDAAAFTKARPAPRVGERRSLRLRNGVITEPLSGATYCDGDPKTPAVCGA